MRPSPYVMTEDKLSDVDHVADVTPDGVLCKRQSLLIMSTACFWNIRVLKTRECPLNVIMRIEGSWKECPLCARLCDFPLCQGRGGRQLITTIVIHRLKFFFSSCTDWRKTSYRNEALMGYKRSIEGIQDLRFRLLKSGWIFDVVYAWLKVVFFFPDEIKQSRPPQMCFSVFIVFCLCYFALRMQLTP